MADIFDLLEIMVKAERAAVRLQLLHDGKAQIYRREAFKLFQSHPAELWETSENMMIWWKQHMFAASSDAVIFTFPF